jgi:hypothetical protein
MFKKFLALPVMLVALLAFTPSAPAEVGIKRSGAECDKMQRRDCDMTKAECDKRHSEYCDKADHRDCDKRGRNYGDHKRGKGGFNILMIADEIGLSAKQVEKIKAIKSSHKKAHIRTDAEIDILKIELKELKRDYSTDIDSYARKVRELEAKKGDEKIARFKMKKEISDVMTSKQRTKVKEYYMKKYKK